MKTREQVTDKWRAAFYSVLFPEIRKVGLDLGYAIAIHGSMARDMDVLAVPWTEKAGSPLELIEAIRVAAGATWFDLQVGDPQKMPHGRVSAALCIYADLFVDLAIIPRIIDGAVIDD